MDDKKLEGISPPSSPLQADLQNRSGHSTFYICKDRLDNVFLLQLMLVVILVS